MTPSPQPLGDAHAIKCELAGEVLRSSGTLRLQAMGWSMLPTVWPGDTLIIDRIHSDAVCDGDIVLFGRDRRVFAHRVLSRNGIGGNESILTRGDAMSKPDAPVSHSDLLGKVSFIVRNGRYIEPSRSLRFPERVVATLVRRSQVAARVVVRVHGLCQAREPKSQVRTSQDRAVPCQS